MTSGRLRKAAPEKKKPARPRTKVRGSAGGRCRTATGPSRQRIRAQFPPDWIHASFFALQYTAFFNSCW